MTITISFVFIALLIIVVALINSWHTRVIAKRLARTVEINTENHNRKLDDIYKVADGRLSDALQTIEDLKALLILQVPPNDPRIKQAVQKNS